MKITAEQREAINAIKGSKRITNMKNKAVVDKMILEGQMSFIIKSLGSLMHTQMGQNGILKHGLQNLEVELEKLRKLEKKIKMAVDENE